MRSPVNRRDDAMDINVRLDLEAEADRYFILYTDRVGRDCALAFGGTPPLDRPALYENGDALGMWTPEIGERMRQRWSRV